MLPIASNLLLLGLKLAAALAIGSVALLSDALDTGMDTTSAVLQFLALAYASRPPDAGHPFGHGKAENLASLVESGLMIVGSAAIASQGIERLLHPRPLGAVGWGIAVMAFAIALNLAVAWQLGRVARRSGSIALTASAKHRLSDVWVSASVLGSLVLVRATGITYFDPALALLVSGYVLWTAGHLVWQAMRGLVDASLPLSEIELIRQTVSSRAPEVIELHRLRTRRVGSERQVDMHLVLCRELSLERSHEITTRLQGDLGRALPGASATIHVEPCSVVETVRHCPHCGGPGSSATHHP
ncbi:MAG: cation transporter [Dehalococcoidia bacterium]|nr:cation transporter [Dehalococcoidia bacterium]